MTFGKDNLIWIAPTAAVLGSAITLAIVGFGAGNAPETASAPAAPTGSASEQANATEAAVDPLSGFNVLVQIPQSGATAQTAPLDGDSIVSQIQRATANVTDDADGEAETEVTRDVPLPLLETAQGIAPLAEPEAVGQEQGTQTGIAAFFTTGQANLAADNPCGDDLRALAEGTRVYFPSGGVKAEESGLVQARVLGRIAQECPNYTLQVRGHSDPTGDPAVNFRLSEKRANALIRLMGSSGIDTTDFITLGMGSAEPSNVAGPLGAAYYDRRVDFAVVERVKTASAASGFQQTWAAPTAAEPACVSALHVRAEQTRLFYNARAITVSPSELGPVYELAQEVMACGGAWLRVMGHHSDVNGDSESVKTGRLRALVLMGSLAAAGYDEERILVGAPSFSAAVDNQPTLPRSRVDFQIIVD